MGISILAKRKSGNELVGSFSTLSGDLHAYEDIIALSGSLASISGSFQGSYSADLVGALTILEGSFGVRNGASIEGSLAQLESSIVEGTFEGTSNGVFLEDDLPLIEGVFLGGGSIGGELSLLCIEGFTGTVHSIGNIDLSGPVITGSMYAGGTLSATSILLSGDMTAIVPSLGRISETSLLSALNGTLTGSVPVYGTLTGNVAFISGVFTGHSDIRCSIIGTLGNAIGSLTGSVWVNGDLTGELNILSGHVTGILSSVGSLQGNLSVLAPYKGLQDAEVYNYGVLRFIRGETR